MFLCFHHEHYQQDYQVLQKNYAKGRVVCIQQTYKNFLLGLDQSDESKYPQSLHLIEIFETSFLTLPFSAAFLPSEPFSVPLLYVSVY